MEVAEGEADLCGWPESTGWGNEENTGRFERILGRKQQLAMVDSSVIWSALGPFYHEVPFHNVAWVRLGDDMGDWILQAHKRFQHGVSQSPSQAVRG